MENPTSPATSLYFVPSASNGKGGIPKYYAVTETPGARPVYRCECPAASFGRGCWHIKVVNAGAVRPASLKAQAPAPRQPEALSLYA